MKGYKGAVVDHVYGFNWLIYKECSHQEAVNHYAKWYRLDAWASDADESVEANFFGVTSLKSYGLWFRAKKPTGDIITHECFHAIVMMAEKLKTPVNTQTEEMFAYYLQLLVREVANLTKKK